MLIPIKIQNKKYQVKPIDELTTKEFIKLWQVEGLLLGKLKDGNYLPDYVKYISWQIGMKFKDAFFAITSKPVEKAIGTIPDVTKLSKQKLDYVDYKKIIDTVGQRHQVENSNLKGFELLVFCLAVAQARSNNIDDVHKLRDDYMAKPFIEILPTGFFFFKIYSHGKKRGRSFSGKLKTLIKTQS